MDVLHASSDLDALEGCCLVPTMGALHEGHASLIRRARADADAGGGARRVAVSIFVNPTQFGPGEDFDRYPRTLEADLGVAESAGADAVFVPEIPAIYPHGLAAAVRDAAAFPLPPTATEPQLEDRIRPGHFGGVCLVVARLLELCRPSRAYFGEKDWQQLRVITQMVERLAGVRRGGPLPSFDPPIMVPCPTVREPDGLALSSRNRYLSREERYRATSIWRAMQQGWRIVAAAGAEPSSAVADAEAGMRRVLEADGLQPEYAVVRDAESLRLPATDASLASLRILIAARIGSTRLIDNSGPM